MEYHGSGQFTFKSKVHEIVEATTFLNFLFIPLSLQLLEALRNLLFAAVAAIVVGLIYIIYMVSTKHASMDQILAFAMAMSNTYGVLLITFFMGSGLAGIPKRLWSMADVEGELTRLYLSAPHIEENYQSARFELEDCEFEIQKAIDTAEKAGGAQSENVKFVHQLKEEMTNFAFANRSTTRAFVKSDPGKVKDYSSKKELVSMHGRLKKAQLKARAAERRWRVLISECKHCQVISIFRLFI
jgi:hypothetical protein